MEIAAEQPSMPAPSQVEAIPPAQNQEGEDLPDENILAVRKGASACLAEMGAMVRSVHKLIEA